MLQKFAGAAWETCWPVLDGGRDKLGVVFIASVVPFPIANFPHIFTMVMNVDFMFQKFVANELLRISGPRAPTRHPVDQIASQVESIQLIQDDHIERGCRGAFF